MNDKGNLIDARPPFLPTFIGTGFGSGFWPWGPGTAGSVAATVIWIVLGLVLPADTMWLQAVTWALAIVFTPIGTWATAWAVVALVLFRFFDIVKPLGIRNLDRRKGAFWVMGDDILGGIYALIVLIICKLLYTWLA